MPVDDPAKPQATAGYQPSHDPRSSGGRAADTAVTIVLLLAHGFVFAATIFVLSMLVMGTDPCGYRKCGDPAWIDRAIGLGLGVGAAVFIADLVVAISLLARQRVAFFVPLLGCAAQVALGIGAAVMESWAGPV